MPICTAKKLDGSSCKARAHQGSALCFFHDNQVAQQRRTAQSAGGRKGKARPVPSSPLPDFDLTTPEGLLASFQLTFNRLVRGEIDAKSAHAMAYLCECSRKLIETTLLKKRLERVEDLANGETSSDQLQNYKFEEMPLDRNIPNA
jgi:hypothetical protein